MSVLEDIFKGGVEGVLSPVVKAIQVFKADATQQAQLDEALALAKIDLETKLAQYDAAQVAAINATMQTESKSEHWMQWSWRPLIGFTFAGLLLNNYVFLGYLSPYGIKPLDIPGEVWSAMLVILGASAAGRSFEKWQKPTNGK